jgi:Carboxypeptidase regulatory-like domain/TonB-dependent Receptor Plug Domain/TonB dependent receptor-like, beta-barrel
VLGHAFRSTLAVVFCLGLSPRIALAQTTGNIEGLVRDPAGAPLPGATVEATSASLQRPRRSISGAYGEYRIPAVPPGVYHLRASLSGFRAAERVATVSLDTTSKADLTIQFSTREELVVSAEVPFVDTNSTSTMTNYTSRLLSHLACDRYGWIMASSPGVNSDRGARSLQALAIAIKGATSAENSWTIDGVNTTDVRLGIQGKAINNELVEEVEVITGGYQAEYGRALGGVINLVTKSGGNTFHGEGFFYYDASAWQADEKLTRNDSRVAKMRVADYTRRDFGADLGGYLIQDRLWFFAAYDRIELPAEISRAVASEEVSTSEKFPLDATTDLYSGKLTWNIGAGTTAVASVFADPSSNAGAGAADPRAGYGSILPPTITNPDPSTWTSTRSIGGLDGSLRWNELFGSRGLLTLQAAQHRDRYELTAPGGVRTEDWTCPGGSPDSPCSPPPAPNLATGGYGWIFGPINRARSRRDQYRGDLNLYLGNHSLKVGLDDQNARTRAISSYTGGQLVRVFNEQGERYYAHQFFAASPEDLTPVGRAINVATVRDLGAYLQDSWKPAPGWTVNAGLRFDEETVRGSADVFILRTSKWQPRLGVAWDPWRDGKTRVYAFAGRFFWGLPTDLALRISGEGTDVATFNFDPSSVTPDPSVPGHGRSNVSASGPPEPVEPGLEAIYQDEYGIGIDRQFSPTFSAGIKATYRRLGNSIEDRCDLDGSRPETNYNTCAIVNPGSGGRIASGDVPGCNGLDGDASQCFETIPAVPAARRLYRGLEMLARKTFGEKLWLQASYVFSSLRGNYDGAIRQTSGQTDPGVNADFDYYLMNHNLYGRLFLDRPHLLHFDGYYTTRSGLSVGLQAFAASGAPLDKLGYFNFSYPSSIQLVQRGYAGRMPTAWDANLTLSYPVSIGPVTATLQGYVFNLLNHQTPIWQDTRWVTSAPAGYPDTLYDPNQTRTNPEYGKIVSRGDPRLFRAAMRIEF